jgi:hypothetical protein
MPAGSVLYLEGKPAPAVQSYLESCASDGVSSAGWDAYGDYIARMALTAENMNGLAELAERHPVGDITFYPHVFHGSQRLLEWWDVDVPENWIFIRKDFGRAAIMAFCSEVGLRCTKTEVVDPA